jgi:hypothetical protein
MKVILNCEEIRGTSNFFGYSGTVELGCHDEYVVSDCHKTNRWTLRIETGDKGLVDQFELGGMYEVEIRSVEC